MESCTATLEAGVEEEAEEKGAGQRGGNTKPIFEKNMTCLNRFLGKPCSFNCSEDYDQNHHPNNLDCSNFYLVSVISFYVHPR